MKLEQWLSEKHIKPSHFARQLDVKPSTIHRLLRGERKPSWALAARIEAETSGEVPLAEWSSPVDHEVAQ